MFGRFSAGQGEAEQNDPSDAGPNGSVETEGSFGVFGWGSQGSNLGPTHYECAALTD